IWKAGLCTSPTQGRGPSLSLSRPMAVKEAPERTQKGQRWLSRSELAELIQTLRKAVPQYYPAARKAEDAQCVVLGRDVFHLQSGLHDQKENRELLRHVEGWKDLGGPKALEAPSPASPPASPPALPPKTPQTPKTSASPAGPAFSPPKTAEKRQKRKAKEEDPAAKKSGGAHCNRAITLEEKERCQKLLETLKEKDICKDCFFSNEGS
ncbi:unnamed protein product, partial [Durusdinium trenchii]